jgi:hypothetical protein
MKGFVQNIETLAARNEDFRQALYTSCARHRPASGPTPCVTSIDERPAIT